MNKPIWRSSQAVHGLDLRTDQAVPVVVGLVETAAGEVQVALRVGDDQDRGNRP